MERLVCLAQSYQYLTSGGQANDSLRWLHGGALMVNGVQNDVNFLFFSLLSFVLITKQELAEAWLWIYLPLWVAKHGRIRWTLAAVAAVLILGGDSRTPTPIYPLIATIPITAVANTCRYRKTVTGDEVSFILNFLVLFSFCTTAVPTSDGAVALANRVAQTICDMTPHFVAAVFVAKADHKASMLPTLYLLAAGGVCCSVNRVFEEEWVPRVWRLLISRHVTLIAAEVAFLAMSGAVGLTKALASPPRQRRGRKWFRFILGRKFFHLVGFVACLPQMIAPLSPVLLVGWLAALSIYVFIEFLRTSNVLWLQIFFDRYITPYTDSRDKHFMITPFSLACGCFFTFALAWIKYNGVGQEPTFDGFLAGIGPAATAVGDAFSGLVGAYFGKRAMSLPLNREGKTLMGMLGFCLSMAACLVGVAAFNEVYVSWRRMMSIVVSAGLVEAYTSRIDNLWVSVVGGISHLV